MDPINLRLPPQDLEAEQSVLGSLMIDKEAIGSIADQLTKEDFYDRRNGLIYEAVLALWEKRAPIDMLSVSAELKKGDVIQKIGGPSYLTDLVDSVPTSAHVAHYASIVKEKKILRDLISTSNAITESAMKQTDDIDVLLDAIEQRVFSITNKSVIRSFSHIKPEIQIAWDRLEAQINNKDKGMRGVPTGFKDLDRILSGLQKSDLVILGARPSFGKTSLALDIGRHVATKNQTGVGFFSLEMSKDQVVDRLIAAESKVSLWKLRTGNIADEDYQFIHPALDKLGSSPIYIDDTPSPNILEIRRMARRLQAEQKDLSLIIIDYLQLIQPRKNIDNPVQQITEISRGLKSIARELNVPILALSQLSRGIEQRDSKVPKLSDLRDSGSIEQDADVVLFLHPAWKYESVAEMYENPDLPKITEIHIAKHRNGPLGIAKLKFISESATFTDLEEYHENTEQY